MRRVETAISQSVKSSLTNDPVTASHAATRDGAIAQLGERLHGMQEVSGSIPLGSTKFFAEAAHWAVFVFLGQSLQI